MVLAFTLAATTVGLAGREAPPAAAVSCGDLDSRVVDQVNPATRSQLLTYRTAEAATFSTQGFTDDRGTPFSAAAEDGAGLSPVHRLYRAASRDYFYTADPAEVARAVATSGYLDQGVAFYASTTPSSCLVAVYSFYRAGVHRFSTTPGERAILRDAGWAVERVRFYAAPPSDDTVFSLVVLPDTQQEVLRSGDSRFINRSQWLVQRQASLDLQFVTHTGDIVNWDTTDHVQYVRAARALAPLEAGGVPYSLSPGNHDTGAVCAGGSACDVHKTRALVRQTTSFNRYLSHGTAELGGRFESGKVDNTYSTFTAGGVKWLVLNLELWPRASAVTWAQRVVSTHQDYNVAVVTHSYLTATGAIYDSSGYGGVSPQYLYDHLIGVYPNVRLVLSGHTGLEASRIDTGANGNRIVSLMLTMHDSATNPLRLIEINTTADTLNTWVYAPYTQKNYRSYSHSYAGMDWVR